MAKSYNQLILEQAEREVDKSLIMRINLVAGDGKTITEIDVRTQCQRLTRTASQITELSDELQVGDTDEPSNLELYSLLKRSLNRIMIERDLLLGVNVEAQSKKKERELVAVG